MLYVIGIHLLGQGTHLCLSYSYSYTNIRIYNVSS